MRGGRDGGEEGTEWKALLGGKIKVKLQRGCEEEVQR